MVARWHYTFCRCTCPWVYKGICNMKGSACRICVWLQLFLFFQAFVQYCIKTCISVKCIYCKSVYHSAVNSLVLPDIWCIMFHKLSSWYLGDDMHFKSLRSWEIKKFSRNFFDMNWICSENGKILWIHLKQIQNLKYLSMTNIWGVIIA